MAELDLARIGNFLKNRRVEQGMSIRELSSISNIAPSTISQIETGKTSPNLMSINAVCEALNFPVATLFVADNTEHVKLVRNAEQQTFVRNVSNGVSMLESIITKGENEMWGGIVNVPAHTNSGEYVYHSGEEFVFILEGTITMDLEFSDTYVLEKHDTLYYPNQIGHRWSNDTDADAQMLIVSTSQYKI